MFIGSLNGIAKTGTYRRCSDIPMPPAEKSGEYIYRKWIDLIDTGFEYRFELDRECFIGAVTFEMNGKSKATDFEVEIDGEIAATRDNVSGSVTVNIGKVGKVCNVRMNCALEHIIMTEPQLIGCYEDGKEFLWPVAKNAEYGDARVKISEVYANAENDDELFAIGYFKERIENEIVNPYCSCGAKLIFKLDRDLAKEEFTVKVGKDEILLSAGGRLSLLWAADTLIQLGNGEGFREADIHDLPTHEFRGFHTGLPRIDYFNFAKQLFRYVLVPLRYNFIILEFCGAMRFDRHPEITETYIKQNQLSREGKAPEFPHGSIGAMGTVLEKDDVRRFVEFATELGIEVIPEIQSLSHVQYITAAHPEIGELEEVHVTVEDTRNEDERPDESFAHSYCPSNEKSYEIIFDIIDEIVEVVRPKRYVHMGHDEVYQVGLCPKCKTQKPEDLYARHVNAVYNHLKEKGLSMMIWADMLHDGSYATSPAKSLIPKDIILLDFIWYFHFGRDIEDELLDAGFKVMVGNLYSSHFPRYKSRIMKEGMIGGQVSHWTSFTEKSLSLIGKFYETIFLSNMLWNTEAYEAEQNKTLARLLNDRVIPKMRENLRGTYSKNGYLRTEIKISDGDKKVPYQIAKVYPETVVADGISLPVNEKYDRLIFDHSSKASARKDAWGPLYVLGEYTVRYTDGTEEKAPVCYGGNVMAYEKEFGMPMPGGYYRHTGYIGTWDMDIGYEGRSENGRNLLISRYTWDNPHPEKAIESVSYKSSENDYCTLMLSAVYGEKRG